MIKRDNNINIGILLLVTTTTYVCKCMDRWRPAAQALLATVAMLLLACMAPACQARVPSSLQGGALHAAGPTRMSGLFGAAMEGVGAARRALLQQFNCPPLRTIPRGHPAYIFCGPKDEGEWYGGRCRSYSRGPSTRRGGGLTMGWGNNGLCHTHTLCREGLAWPRLMSHMFYMYGSIVMTLQHLVVCRMGLRHRAAGKPMCSTRLWSACISAAQIRRV
eukprot:jgi/Ulvmu1/11327/UM074_0042.1